MALAAHTRSEGSRRHDRGSRRRSTRGASLVSVVCIILVVMSGLSLLLKLGPHYLDFRTVRSIIEQLPEDQVNTMPRTSVYEALSKRFPLNNLYDLKARDIITYERTRESTILTVDYEQRENLFMNIDVVIRFNERYEFR